MAFEVNYEQMKNYENKQDILIIDVREPSEIATTGKIGGSINIPVANLESELKNLGDLEFKQKYGRDKPSEDFPLVFSCKLGGRAARAANIANDLGYKNAKVYKGSWAEWERKMNVKN